MNKRTENILNKLKNDKHYAEKSIKEYQSKIKTYEQYLNEERLQLAEINALIRKLV